MEARRALMMKQLDEEYEARKRTYDAEIRDGEERLARLNGAIAEMEAKLKSLKDYFERADVAIYLGLADEAVISGKLMSPEQLDKYVENLSRLASYESASLASEMTGVCSTPTMESVKEFILNRLMNFPDFRE